MARRFIERPTTPEASGRLASLCDRRQESSPQTYSVCSSAATNSPVPSWWDDVFEAADLVKLHQNVSGSYVSGKRKLFSSPLKGASAEDILDTKNSSAACLQHSDASASGNHVNQSVTPLNSFDCSFSALHTNKKLYPSHQKIYSAKLALNSGREHITSNGKVRPARFVKAPCQERCKRCQRPKLTDGERLNINKEFWYLNDHVKQWKFIKNSIIISAPKTKFAVKGSKGEKLSSRIYSFVVDGKSTKVCKTMFKNTLCICDSWIDSAISHSSDSGFLEDRRGKHNNRTIRGHKYGLKMLK